MPDILEKTIPRANARKSAPPVISVAMCNYNHAKYLKMCLAGILRQTFRDFEVIVTDDGSTDGSQDVILEMAAQDPRIVVNLLPKNVGVMKAVAQSVERVRGEFIYNEASDDFLIDAEFFARAVRSLREHPQAAGYYAVTGLFSEERQAVYSSMGSAPKAGYISPEEFYPMFLQWSAFVPGSSSLWRRECYDTVGGFDYRLGPQIDYLMNHLLPCLRGVVFEPVPVKIMRTFDKPTSYSTSATLWAQAERFSLVEQRIRESVPAYAGMEQDWVNWRAKHMKDAIPRSGAIIQ